MAAKNRKENVVLSWVKNPASWIAVASLLVTLISFYILNLRDGDIKVQLLEQIAIRVYPQDGKDSFTLIVPAVFRHTGAASRRELVTSIDATLRVEPEDGAANQQIICHWKYLYRFVGKYSFEKQYPDKAQNAEDYVEYESRNLPFNLSGGDVTLKVLGLEPDPSATIVPANIELCIKVTQERTSLPSCNRYRLPKNIIEEAKSDGLYKWLVRDSKGN